MSKLIYIIATILFISSLMGCDAKFSVPPVTTSIPVNDSICELCLEISISTPNLADGVTPTYLDLQIFDTKMRPLADYAPILDFAGAGAEQTTSLCNRTDFMGRSRCRVTTTKSGEREIWLRGWKKATRVTFYKPLPLRGLYQIGAGASLRTSTRSTLSLGAQASPIVVKDNHNIFRARFSHLGGSF